MSAAIPSNVRVFVTFKEDTIFAGEDIEATITFKNVEPPKPPQQDKSKQRSGATVPPIRESPASTQLPASQPASRTAHSRHASVASQSSRQPPRSPAVRRTSQLGHRQALSLNVLDTSSRKDQSQLPQSAGTAPGTPRRGSQSHGRSVSIVSIGSDAEKKGKRGSIHRDPGRPGLKLSRSASVQITPTTGASSRWGFSASNGGIKPAPSPLQTATSVPEGFPWGKPPPTQPSPHTRHASAGNGSITTPRLSQSRTASGRVPQSAKLPPSSFKFPPSPSASPAPPQEDQNETPRLESVPFSPASSAATAIPAQSDFPQQYSKANPAPSVPARLISPERKPPLNRVFSLSSEAGTPRTSTDLYSSSNHSDDTMASEIPSAGGLLKRPPFFRNSSSLASVQRRHGPETLMMGFANVTGSFQLDGSLVNQAPFEDVKRRAVVGGQGAGGVVGVDQRKQGGFFGGFTWGGISESLSLGGMLGGDQQSTIREMKNTAESNTVPLLSTPKSILFVDLRLAPGESRSYSYSFTLPRGLPPSHRGRAMKVMYQIVIGTQRPGNGRAREQQMRQVEIPFRVFGGVDARGEILGHDLMSPYIILRDQAKSSQIDLDANGKPATNTKSADTSTQAQKSSEADFNTYVNKLLSSPRRNSSTGLISPTATTFDSPTSGHSRRPSGYGLPPPPPTRVLVDSAIRISTQPLQQRDGATNVQSQTNFTIARAGRPVATLTLSRPALRLGDLLNLTLDFGVNTTPPQPSRPGPQKTLVHAITLTLESTEHIDPSLAVRSAASIDRATRRVWDKRVVGGSQGAALGWCKRWSGGLKIPSNATPSFGTTGVECKWFVRVEIAVGVSSHRRRESMMSPNLGDPSQDDDSEEENDHQGEGAARRRERQEVQAHSPAPSSSEDVSTPSGSPAPSRINSLRRKPTLSRQNTLKRQQSQKQKQIRVNDEQAFARSRQLLERVLDDERGVTLAAVRRVPGDVFEIAVPIRIFGGIGVMGQEPSPAADEGLPV